MTLATDAGRTDGFVVVTEDKFYAVMGPLNVNPRPQRHITYWETPERALLGISTPGYSGDEEYSYKIRADLAAAKGSASSRSTGE